MKTDEGIAVYKLLTDDIVGVKKKKILVQAQTKIKVQKNRQNLQNKKFLILSL